MIHETCHGCGEGYAMIGQGILETIAMWFLGKAWSNRRMMLLVIRCNLWKRNQDIRIAFSAVLRIDCGDRYLLVRNLHRRTTFAPFGGVVKFDSAAREFLDSIDFKPETFGPGVDMLNDIRGFVPRKNLCRLVRWYKLERNRESEVDCIKRELAEELAEVKLSLAIPRGIVLRLVRSVREGPVRVPTQNYLQFRVFDVYTLVDDSSQAQFCVLMMEAAQENRDILLVTRGEIESGGSIAGDVIAPHTRYFFGTTYVPEVIPMTRIVSGLPQQKDSTSDDQVRAS